MPRKYRPPASTRRRKTKTVEYDFPTPEPGVEAAVAEEDAAEAIESSEEEYVEPVAQGKKQPAHTASDRPERHVRRDYSYVRNDAIRIAVIGGILIAAIIVAGFFR